MLQSDAMFLFENFLNIEDTFLPIWKLFRW